MSQFSELDVVALHNINDNTELKLHADWLERPWMYDDMNTDPRTGLNTDVIVSLLDKIGSEGGNPTMAYILFRAGIEQPIPDRYELRTHSDETVHKWGRNLYAVYLKSNQRPHEEPEALILTEGTGRKLYRGFKEVRVNTWINHSKVADGNELFLDVLELEREALKHIFTNHPTHGDDLFVEQETILHGIGGDDPRVDVENGITVEALGILPEDYANEYAFGPRNRILMKGRDISAFRGQPELLEKFSNLFTALKLDVIEQDCEGGQHYEYILTDEELSDLIAHIPFFDDKESITGISLDLEDRPMDYYDCIEDKCNSWGDMTIHLRLEKGVVATIYTFIVNMDMQAREAWLYKYTVENEHYIGSVGRGLQDMLGSRRVPQESQTNLNEIDEFENSALVKLVSVMAERLHVK